MKLYVVGPVAHHPLRRSHDRYKSEASERSVMTITEWLIVSVSIPRQSRGLYFMSRSKRLFGVADAAPLGVSRLKRLLGSLTRPRLQEPPKGGRSTPQVHLLQTRVLRFLILDVFSYP